MIIDYIGADGNKKQTADVVAVPANLEQIGKIWFEKREVEKKEEKKVVIEEVIAEVANDEIELRAKEFLKEKKVRGFGLLK
jgi:hypothetical protein